MECNETQPKSSSVKNIDVEENDSADNFQKFIYDLFDKNGILNDLRAYLRGHIVNVLQNAQTGDPPLCQKHYTQRLELVSQALNILIAEYLLQLEFSYSLSVFVSEIPLSNMVFDFAKTLFQDKPGSDKLRFKEGDIWSVLNYLGVKCDSEHASNIVEMYKSDKQVPLLLCILKCVPMYRKQSVGIDEDNSSRDSLTSSVNSVGTLDRKARVQKKTSCHEKCKHYAFCKSCQNRITRMKEKYKDRKKDFLKDTRRSSMNPLNVENFMKNINVMEKRIINEMFEQLQTVYEAEVDLVRQEEETRVKRTLASHALRMQQRRDEIEESLKAKEAELESNAQHKKQFLWGVARSLREQHERVARAMTLLKEEQEKLALQEKNVKTQLSQAEETLRKKGEEMRIQISHELQILEGHMETMKRERDSLNRERSDLEHLKTLCDSKTRIIEAQGVREREDMKQHYGVLKDEIAVLKKYIESSKVKPKCVIEKSTITDFVEVPSNSNHLNNTNIHFERNPKSDVGDRDARPPNQLVNDLKKQKNVNFSQSNLDEAYGEVSRSKSRCSASSEEAAASASETAGVRERDAIQRLVEENESLKDYARQQRDHIAALWSARRPRTAPSLLPAANYFTVHGVNPSTSANTFGWRKGAGEELSVFPAPPPPAAPLAGDQAARVGMLRDRHADTRRHLMNQWRALKRRSSPLAGINKARAPIHIQRDATQRDVTSPVEPSATVHPAIRIADEAQRNHRVTSDAGGENQSDERQPSSISKTRSREKSPKTVLKEAKENLRTKNNIKENPPVRKREKSPNSMLREAKLRLRKLEIEAEAVEKSYLDFRKRQAELREERRSLSMLEDQLNADDDVKNLDTSKSRSLHKLNDHKPTEPTLPTKEMNDAMKIDFDKYLCNYQTKFNIGETYFKNRNTAVDKVKPIPIAYSDVNPKKDKRKIADYLDTPIMEFRKLYHAEKERRLTSDVATKSDVTNVYKHGNITVMSTEDPTNVISKGVGREIPKDNLDCQELHNTENAAKINTDNKINVNINGEIKYSENSNDYTFDAETKLLDIEDKSNTADVIEYRKLETVRTIKRNKAAELEILKENINKIYNFKSPRSSITPVTSDDMPIRNNARLDNEDRNVLRVEVESTCDVNKVQMSESREDDLFIVVQSSASTKETEGSEEAVGIPLTVELSPKERTGPKSLDVDNLETPKSKRSDSPEKSAHLTRTDALNAIFHADDTNNVSSDDMNVELSNEVKETLSDAVEEHYGDYQDDLSADVDNYNSRSEYGNNSPISLPKSLENDNFWDNN